MFSKHCAGHELQQRGCNKKAILELVSCVWEERVFARAQVPYFCSTRKIDPEAQGPSPPCSPFPRSPARARLDLGGFPVTR